MMNVNKIALILLFVLVSTGCETVQPWERDVLAQDKMQLEPNPIENALDEHIYFSKEAASGGQGVAGGGCGCN